MNRIFGDILKEIRLSRGLSQEEFANKLKTTKQVISRYENNLRTPKITIAKEYADILNIPLSYLLGDETYEPSICDADEKRFPSPTVAERTVKLPIIGTVAAGYDSFCDEDYSGVNIELPESAFKGHSPSDFFVLTVQGDSMYPSFLDGDTVVVLKQSTVDRSGDVGVIIYDSDLASLKKLEFSQGEDWLRMVPINPEFQPREIRGPELEECRVLGIPFLLLRDF